MPLMGPQSRRRFDGRVAVIGAGLSGLRTAADLANRMPHVDVIVLDAGPFTRREHEAMDQRDHPGDARQRGWTSPGPQWRDSGGLKLRVGGRSLCWHGQLLPIENEALAGWPEIWRGRLENHYETILATLAPLDEPPLKLSGDWLRAGLLPVRQAGGFILNEAGLVSAFSAYSPLSTACELPNVTILAGSSATHVECNYGQVRVFQQAGEPIEADFCVLSAGAIVNVALLAQSLGRDLRVPLCDHDCAGAVMAFHGAEPGAATVRGEASLLGYQPDASNRANGFFQELAPLAGDTRAIDCWVLSEQLPDSASILTCRPTSAGAASLEIEPRLTEGDARRTERALGQATGLLERMIGPVRDVIALPDETEAIECARARPGVLARYSRPIGSVDHEACSHAIGALCDEDLCVTELPGVYLNGPGVFPRAGAANPGLTILAVASWLAGALAERLA